MTKPMYCPISFANSSLSERLMIDAKGGQEVKTFPQKCTPNCAWAVRYNDKHGTREYFCAIAKDSFYGDAFRANTRPLEDDAE